MMLAGAAHGAGIYVAVQSGTAAGYSVDDTHGYNYNN